MKFRKIFLPMALSLAAIGLAACSAKNETKSTEQTQVINPTDGTTTPTTGGSTAPTTGGTTTPTTGGSSSENTTPINIPDSANVNLSSSMELITKGSDMESLYAEVSAVKDATDYNAYVKKSGTSSYIKVDKELIRLYKNGDSYKYRIDVVGLAAGSYDLKVTYTKDNTENTGLEITSMNVAAYDRSGFAFSKKSSLKTASGAYNDDGTLRDGAQVIYLTSSNAKTVKATVNGTECTGIQTILDAKQKKTATEILDIRIIGTIYKNDLDHISSSAEGLQIKGAGSYQNMGITIEGIGDDATIHGFGMLLRNCGNVEIRNIGIMAFMDDGLSLDTDNCNIWIHDNDFFYGSTGGDSDQAKGDGSLDTKGHSTYVTYSYNHFWDSGKCNLQGMKSESSEDTATYHHNWFDHSDSRHPRVRTCTVHVYNNYYDGNSKYGIGATMGSSIFSEANYFRNCKYPILSSLQGNDALGEGTFSGENGGMVKSYNDYISGGKGVIFYQDNNKSFDAYKASSRNETIDSSIKTVSGGTTYNNFDTSSDMYSYIVDTPEVAMQNAKAYAGRLNGGDFKWIFTATDDDSYAVDSALKAAIVAYKNTNLVATNVTSSSSTTPTETEGGNNQSEEVTTITAEDVIQLIDALPNASAVTSADGANIIAASNAYNSLSDSEKEKVTNSNKLTEVLNAYSSLGQALTFKNGAAGDNSFFTVAKGSGAASLKSGVASKTYDGVSYSSALKVESATTITFNTTSSAKLVIITDSTSVTLKVDNVEKTPNSDGVIIIENLASGSHTISRGSGEAHIYAVIVS